MKFCIHCKHFIAPFESGEMTLGKCGISKIMNRVTGEVRHLFAENARLESQPCGMEAKNFEPTINPTP